MVLMQTIVKREIKISGMEKILLHLNRFNRHLNKLEVPPSLTQQGIARATEIARPHISTMMRKLEEKGLVYEKVCHIQGKKRWVKAYFLTNTGVIEAKIFEKELRLSQYIDFADHVLELRYFFGREKEIREFKEWMESDIYKMLVISGFAGIGKTAYINKSVAPYRESMHMFWHRVSEWSTLRSVISRLADFLYELGKDNLSAHLRAKETIDVNEIALILEKDLMHLNVLLIFDDYQKVKDNKELTHMFGAFMGLFEQIDKGKLVLSGREVPRFFYDEREVSIKKTVKELNLGGLDRKSSLKMLEMRGIVGPKGKQLHELTGGHPLSLELIHETEKVETQDELKRFIQDEIFSHLTPKEREVLEIASVFRYPIYPTAYLDIAGIYPKDTPNDLPPSLLGISFEETDKQIEGIDHEVIDSLVKKSLLQISRGVCDIHDIIKAFLYARLPEHTRKRYHEKIATYYLREIGKTSQTELEAQYHLVEAGEFQKAAKLAVENGKRLIEMGYWQEFLGIINMLLLETIEPQHHSEILLLRGSIYNIRGELDRAIGDYQQSVELFRATDNKRGEAAAYREMGAIMWRRSRWDESLKN